MCRSVCHLVLGSEAMAAATLLSGFSGVAIAAAAGCSGFAGSLGGREVVPWQLLLLPELRRTGT